MNKPLGSVIEGSLTGGLEVRLHPDILVEDMRVGKFLVVRGRQYDFFCLLTDVCLGTSSDRILVNPPHPEDDFLLDVLSGSGTYGTVNLSPMLMLNKFSQIPPSLNGGASLSAKGKKAKAESGKSVLASFEANTNLESELLPVKTVPSHFSQVFDASAHDFRSVFGWEDDPNRLNFSIGQPLDMDVPVCLDLQKFVERSNGVFGKSGTGKSFLTRLLLAGVIRKRVAVNLIFDMHSEYGWEAVQEGKKVSTVKGLRQLFPNDVIVYTLDPDSSRNRGIKDAQELILSYEMIELEDLQLVSRELGLSDAALDNAAILANSEFGNDWIRRLLEMTNEDIKDFCDSGKGHQGSISSLQRKLMRLQKLKYLQPINRQDNLKSLMQSLKAGKNIVIEFGNQSDLLSYMLVTNMLTRRIHKLYVDKAERYLQSKQEADRPTPLIITIEEAHRFLDPAIAKSTIFGTIAREMRKFFVTLLIVDQRPSGIDNEIMSQIGTRITALINDEKDIDAIFTGVSGAQGLKSVLAKLDSKQQALVLGHAVPMPVVVRTRPYDHKFYEEIGDPDWKTKPTEEVMVAAAAAQMDLGI
jgi:uncharacterized protein